MSRVSGDELASDGTIYNGFDYHLQVWVVDGHVVDCNHQPRKCIGAGCCNARRYGGLRVKIIPGHEVREI